MRVGDFSPSFGKNIRYLRTLSRLSQKSLGLLIGVTLAEIKKLENAVGIVHLDSNVLMRILQVFGIALSDLVDRDLEEEGYQLPWYQYVYYPAVYEDRNMQ